MSVSENILLEGINDKYAIQLVEILNYDIILQDSLGSKRCIISKDDFIKYNNEWSKNSNSEIFAILLNNNAIGIISLSHQNIEEKKAQIGYWIGSKYWRKGYTSQAFSQILGYAKRKEIKYLNAKIQKDNIASQKIWQQYSAKIELINNKIYVSIVL
ncbi:GNAT family N-acetyltransferase [Clostridium saccharobutylicum]|uniref:Ribosomal-protein-L7/L12-serine acetyltransferase n=1 Tax=Clostridium saccharobutylicum TaxID=169679 RepID=A0A1S8MSQ7_CLOSA|nr:GNAT family N-acetyltransferase [Clostridium saccharobutylicum]OOM07218.1 ribosomal-protein-L7/L12-serine acetyltransferase [Clostridium saccharobutylicum]